MKHLFHRTLAAWFALAIAIMLGVAAVVFYAFRQTVVLDRSVTHTSEVIGELNDVFAAAVDVDAGTRGYVISGDTLFLEQSSAGNSRIALMADTLVRKTSGDPAQAGRAEQLRATLVESGALSENAVALRGKGELAAAREHIADGRAKKLMAQARSLVNDMKAEEERLLIKRSEVSARARTLAISLGVIGVLLSMVIIGLVFALVRREGRRRLAAESELSAANQQLRSSLDQSDRLLQEKQMVDRLAGLLHSCSTLAEAHQIIGTEVRHALPEVRGAVYLLRASGNLVEAVSHWNDPVALRRGKSFAPQDCWALKSGARHVMQTRDDLACAHVDALSVEASVCIPLNVPGETVGVLYVEAPPGHLDEARLDLLGRIGHQIGMSLATLRLQEQLRDLTFLDPLTGLFNRRYFEAAIEKEVNRADRAKEPVCLVMIDIDHFKQMNDQYGHRNGDLILQAVSETLSRHTRSSDIACRYGGEEFLLVLSGASIQAAWERAEASRQAVEKRQVVLDDGTTARAATISAGVAAYPRHGLRWQEVAKAADEALYKAKNAGRNRVLVGEVPLH